MSARQSTAHSQSAQSVEAHTPEFDLHLPPGWERHAVNFGQQDSLITTVRRRAMDAHRPDFYAQASGMIEESFATLAASGIVAFFTPGDDAPEAMWLPAAFAAGIVEPPEGVSFDEVVVMTIQDYGATSLDGDRRFVRWVQKSVLREGDTTLRAENIVYLTPVPGAEKKRALRLTVTLFSSTDAPDDDPLLVSMRELFDNCVSTLTWQAD